MKKCRVHFWFSLTTCLGVFLPFICLTSADIENCPYQDTVDITGSELKNGFYHFDGVDIPENLTGFYDYEILAYEEHVEVPRHLRGCICRIRTCIKLCCPVNESKVPGERECASPMGDQPEIYPFINVTQRDGQVRLRNVLEDFIIQTGVPCSVGMAMNDSSFWDLFESGDLFVPLESTDQYKTKNDYCFLPYMSEELQKRNFIPMVCLSYPGEQAENLMINYITMLISIPLMIVTILVYGLIPELRNLHGKCLIAYLSSQTLGQIMLNLNTTLGLLKIDPGEWCSAIGFSAYFFFISAFLWLSIISFDLWYNFRGATSQVPRFLQRKRFLIYSLVAWPIALLLTGLTMWAQWSNLDSSLKPGVGESFCWIDVYSWSALIYFFGPMLIVIIFNTVMFIMTAVKIYQVQKELSRFAAREKNIRHMNAEKDEVRMFMRLFVVMGISWMFEVVTYFVQEKSFWKRVFYVTDFYNCAQGIIIFILFVLKRRVIMLIRKRLNLRGSDSMKLNNRNKSSLNRTTSSALLSGTSLTQHTDI